MHQNIAGLLSKSDALQISLDELLEKHVNVDVLCITEHFMMSGHEALLNIHNYNLADCFCRSNSKRGGTCILVKNEHQWRELPEVKNISLANVFECCAIELTDYKIVIVCLYRIPNYSNLQIFFEKLEKVLMYINKIKCKQVLIAGDFNIDMLKRNNTTVDLECLLRNYNLRLALKQATRIASMTCIDNFAHNYNRTCKTEVLEFALSDHTAQLIKIPVRRTLKLKFWRKEIRDYSSENILKFKRCIEKLSFSEVYDSDDPTLAYHNFYEIFKLFYDLCFPIKVIKINTTYKPKWISRGLKICSKRKRNLLWKFRLEPTRDNKLKFIRYSKLFKSIIRQTKRAQNNHAIQTSNNKSKTTWQMINDNNRVNLPKEPISKIKLNTIDISNPTQIADSFNNYFIDKIKPVDET